MFTEWTSGSDVICSLSHLLFVGAVCISQTSALLEASRIIPAKRQKHDTVRYKHTAGFILRLPWQLEKSSGACEHKSLPSSSFSEPKSRRRC